MKQFVCALTLMLTLFGAIVAAPLATFSVADSLQHRWADEVVHFNIDVATSSRELCLTDAAGAPMPCQFSNLVRKNGRVKGVVWSVVTVEPGKEVRLLLQPGKPRAATMLRLDRKTDPAQMLLSNENLTVALPILSGVLATPRALADLPTPISQFGRLNNPASGHGAWAITGEAPLVTEATTTVTEEGPVRTTVRQHYQFADGRAYTLTVRLAARQEIAEVFEDTDKDAVNVAFRLRFSEPKGNTTGMNTILWHNQWAKTPLAGVWQQVETYLPEQKTDTVICKLRPWSFWWSPGLTMWAGFFDRTATDGDIAGVLAMRPARWTPIGEPAFAASTEVPVTWHPATHTVEMDFRFAAQVQQVNGKATLMPMHREWALAIGKTVSRVDAKQVAHLRRLLIKHSEFPLDEVKDFGFAFTPKIEQHPRLLFSREDVERVRRQAKENPTLKANIAERMTYTDRCVGNHLEREGWEAFYEKVYWGTGLTEKLPEAYLTSDDPRYGPCMAAAVKGLTRDAMRALLEQPNRPSIGSLGPWYTDSVMRLLFAYDLIAGQGLLTAAEETQVRNSLVLCAYALSHPDYWNTDLGLCSGNPNMTVAIILPVGLLGMALDGHPQADRWVEKAESELKLELADFISPEGTWIEAPGYQAASLDAIFVLAQGLRNTRGRDYFQDPLLKATMAYYGQLLTPPDPRFPVRRPAGTLGWMTIPTVGDTPAGFVTIFPGWLAKASEKTDPAYSAQQAFFWKGQGATDVRAGRANGYGVALVDFNLPAKPPAALGKAFPGFGATLRSSWTDPKASYVSHRTGPNLHHYHDDVGSIIYFAKGAPLVMDFGNQYHPIRRDESWMHSRVSFDIAGSKRRHGGNGQIVEVRDLPAVVGYSMGKTTGSGGQLSERHLLLVKSPDPLGAHYLLMRDFNANPQPGEPFYWNLWVMATGVEGIADGRASTLHFPGQFGVDLDVSFLQPTAPHVVPDQWGWKFGENGVNIGGQYTAFEENMHGVHASGDEPSQSFFTLLYPRAAGQAAAKVTRLGEGGARIEHLEGSDLILLSPGKTQSLAGDTYRLQGEIAFARKTPNGSLRLAVVKGQEATAFLDNWGVTSTGAASLIVEGTSITGETSGPERTLTIYTPRRGKLTVSVDGKPVEATQTGGQLVFAVPAGEHVYAIRE
ncbi:MAG: hypothetical protein ACYDBB_09055 [Armatimonadota bacterium]